tara:strand:- start:49064 stop:50011 length:948 start_codon:yes stop_codon:yes gene_type:complete
LEIAVTVIAEGSMSAAAERLELTQSAVSQAMKRAEAQFGATLIHRDCRPYVSTKAGQMLAQEMPLLQQRIEQAIEKVRGAAATPERFDLRLGMIDTFAATVGPLLLRDLIDGALALQLSALSGLAPAQADAMKQHSIDAAVTSETLRDATNLDRFPLYREPFLLVCPIGDVDKIKGLSLADILAKNRLIHYSARSHMGRQVDRHLQRVGLEQQRVLAFDTSDSLLAMVGRSVGVAISTPLGVLQGGLHRDTIAVLPLPGPGFSREIALYVRRGELTTLGPRIAEIARDIIRSTILPQIITQFDWLEDQADTMVIE